MLVETRDQNVAPYLEQMLPNRIEDVSCPGRPRDAKACRGSHLGLSSVPLPLPLYSFGPGGILSHGTAPPSHANSDLRS